MIEDLPERPLTGEPLALDLVNTQWVEAAAARDLLALPDGMPAFLRAHGLSVPHAAESAYGHLQGVRAVLRRCLASDDADEDARRDLNAVLERGRIVPLLEAGGPGERVEVADEWAPAWRAARDYLAMRAEWPRWRVRACAHPDCILYFLDRTRNGTRRWCDMRTCGNRAKAQRYHERHGRN